MKRYNKKRTDRYKKRERHFNYPEIELIPLIEDIAKTLCESENIELVLIEKKFESDNIILRVYIDKEGGVTLDDCVNINRQLGDLLDVNLENAGTYRLEVSSPGIERPLVKETDFDKFKGNIIKMTTEIKINEQKNFKGVLEGINKGMVELLSETKKITIPFSSIKKARIDYDNGDKVC